MTHTRIAIAIAIAGALVALAIYLRPVPDRYRFVMSDGQITRYDTTTGEALVCDGQACARLRPTAAGRLDASFSGR